MTFSYKIGGALLLGLAIVAFAFFAERPVVEKAKEPGSLAVTNPANHEPIPEADSDGDGIPDWKETLDIIEPIAIEKVISLSTTTATSTEPKTYTQKLAVGVMEDILTARMNGLDPLIAMNSVISSKIADLQFENRDILYTSDDISTYTSHDPENIRSYVNQLANIALSYPLPQNTLSEVLILHKAVSSGNMLALSELDPIIESYNGILTDSIAVPVPAEYEDLHLNLINSYKAIETTVQAFRNTETDPVWSMIRLKRYEGDVFALKQTLLELGKRVRSNQAALETFQPDDPVFVAFGFIVREL